MGPRIQYDPGVSIPASFPREKAQGAVPGAQPKFLATLVNNRYVGVATDEDVRIRYLICTDYVKRITEHLQIKLLEVSIPTNDFVECLLWDFQLKGFSSQEGLWMIVQVLDRVGALTYRPKDATLRKSD
ncbi:hypothetical protein KXJ72_16120 [Comamonas aquatica]|nr:hypothetical protein KXJ72_16120 [Comamonas aquatica]